MSSVHLRAGLIATVALLAFGLSAAAQDPTGRIDVIVRDDARAAPLGGVELEARGGQHASAVTDAHGRAHLVGLAPGEYVVIARLQGFNEYRSINIPVFPGRIVPLEIWLSIAGSARQVDTRIDAPRIDVRGAGVSTILSYEELQNVPWQGDPWTMLQTAPGVFIDRVNVAGEHSGQQAVFEAKGSDNTEHVWNFEGIPVTDVAAPGSSAAYYDMGAVQDMRVTIGGASATVTTPGVQVDIVLPGGTDQWRASGRAYIGPHGWQSSNIDKSLRSELASYSRSGDYSDAGVEAGGPAVEHRVFVWGSAARTRPERRVLTVGPSEDADAEVTRDTTVLQTYTAKAVADVDARTRAQFTFLRNRKTETGRGASSLDIYAPTFDQDGPTAIYAASIQRRIGDDLFIEGRAAHITNEFTLTHRITQSSFAEDRPQTAALVNGNWFRGTHQLGFGFSWRDAKDRLTDTPLAQGTYMSAFAADTIVRGRATFALAARWDRARSSALSQEMIWNSLTPRFAGTYVVNADRTSLIRGTYAVLPAQLGATAAVSVLSPTPFDQARAMPDVPLGGAIGAYRTPLTHEATFGAEHALSNGFTLSGRVTWRRAVHTNWLHYAGVTAADYVLVTRLTGDAGPVRGFDVPVYVLGTVPSDLTRVYEARKGYHRRYLGLEVAADRRLAYGLLMRLSFSTNDDREYFDSPDGVADPTPTLESPNKNGGAVVHHSNVSGAGDVFLVAPRYQFAGTVFYQGPLGIDLAVNYTVRQGYAMPFFRSGVAPDALAPAGKDVLVVPDAGFARLWPPHTMAGRISKGFTKGHARLFTAHLDLDVFNVFNRNVVLARGYDLARPDFNRARDVMNPRAFRVGLRLAF